MQPHRIGVANFACGEVPEMYRIYEIDAVCSPEHCEAIFMRGVPEMYRIYEIDAVCSLTALA